jgi:Arm DNA-binding domain/Phage integrase, N-terminal SAM-like domain
MGKLTKRTVEAAQPQASDYFLWDGDLAGFGLRVMPSGRRGYLVQYRAGGRTRRVGLGVHGAVTPDQARKRARDLLGAVARGEDPAEEIRTHRRAPTVGALCDRFLAEHVAHRCKPSTQGEYRRSVDLFIKPRIGNLKLPDVKRADISRLHHDLRHIPYQANRTLGVLSKMFNLAELWGLMPDGANPCRHIKKYPERKRERFLSPEEYRGLWLVLAELEAERPAMRPALNAIRLLVLTGCRLSEIQTLRWEHVRETALELPDGKTGARKGAALPCGDRRAGLDREAAGQRLCHHRDQARPAPDRPRATLAAHPGPRRPRRSSDPRPPAFVRLGRGRQRREPADDRETPRPQAGADHGALRPPGRRSRARRGWQNRGRDRGGDRRRGASTMSA